MTGDKKPSSILFRLQSNFKKHDLNLEYGEIIQNYWQNSRRYQFQILGLFLLGVIMVSIVAGLYLNITARAATYGRQIQALQAEIQTNDRLSADLESQLARLTSAETIAVRAGELGFVESSKETFEYIAVPGYAGREVIVLAPPPGPVQASEARLPVEFTESLLDWLRQLTLRPAALLTSEVLK
jgi:hypothetical protein